MEETLSLVLDILRIDFLIGFGFYSILYFFISLLKRNSDALKEFDSYACRTVVLLGIVYLVVWITSIALLYFQAADNDKKIMLNRMSGPYWFGYFLQPLFWIGLTQLMRIKILQRSTVFRVVMSLMFVITFEIFVIIATSFERDYLPNTWETISLIEVSWIDIVLGLTMKIMEFIFLVSIYYYGSKKLKHFIRLNKT